MKLWNTNLRFNIDKSPYKEAYAFLKSMDRQKYRSYNHVIASALTEFFERREKESEDPFFETREREEEFISRIVEAVRFAVEKAMPEFMASYLLEKSLIKPQVSEKAGTGTVSSESVLENANSDTAAEDINFDFVGN